MREAAVLLSATGHKGPVVGPEQLSPARVTQAVLPLQVYSGAYLQVFMLKQTAHRCRSIYSTGSICFTNIDKKWLVWQQYLAGNFGFALCIPLQRTSCLQIQALARLACMQSCGVCLCFPVAMTAVFFFSFSLLAVLFFYVLLFSFFPSFSGERKSVLLHWWESLWIAKPQQYVLYFIQRRGARRFVAGSRLLGLLRYMETALLGLGFC